MTGRRFGKFLTTRGIRRWTQQGDIQGAWWSLSGINAYERDRHGVGGMVGDSWEIERFSSMGAIPTAVSLTTYAGGAEDFMATPLQDFINVVESGAAKVPIGKVFTIDEIVEAHRTMEENKAGGKIVITT